MSFPPWEVQPGEGESAVTESPKVHEVVEVQVDGRLTRRGKTRAGFVCLSRDKILFRAKKSQTGGGHEPDLEAVCHIAEVTGTTETDAKGANVGGAGSLGHSRGSSIDFDAVAISATPPGGVSLHLRSSPALTVALDDGSELTVVFTAMEARADRDRFQAMVALKMVEVDRDLKQQYEDGGPSGGGPARPPSSSSLNFGSSAFGKSGFGDRLATHNLSSPRRGYRPVDELTVRGGGGGGDDRGRAVSFAGTGSTDIETSRSMTTTGIHLGERVVVADPLSADHTGEGMLGVLKYCGTVHFRLGECCGIALDIPSGNCSGRIGNTRYFSCPRSHGLFVSVNDISETEKTEMIAAEGSTGTRRKLLLPRPTDEPDTNPSCHVCAGDFNALRRRHHCRNCGGLCCDKCSPTKCEIPYLGYFKPARVCTDCHDTVALFSRASGVVKKGKQQIGLVLDRRAQIRAIDEIKDKITSPDCFAMVRCGLVDLVMMLTALPLEAIKFRGLSTILALTQHTTLQEKLIKAGVLDILSEVIRSQQSAQALVDAANAISMLIQNRGHRLAATRVDVISNMLLHLADSNTNLDVIGTEIVSVLCEDTVCQQLICTSRSGEQLYRILALAARITDSFCQKNMLLAIAHLTTTFANARRCFNANIILCDVFRPLIAKLVADEHALTVAEDTARKQSLAHLSCVLANLAVLGEWDVNRSMLAGSLAMMVKHLGKQSDEFLEHISRGLANVSFYPQSADILLRCLKYLIPALRMTKTATKVSILKLLNNLLVTKGTDTADVLSRWPDFADIIRELVTTGVEPTVVKSLAHRLHMSLQGEPYHEVELLDVEPEDGQGDRGLYPPEASPPASFEFGGGNGGGGGGGAVGDGSGVAAQQGLRSMSLSMKKRNKKKRSPEQQLTEKLDALAAQRKDRLARLEALLAGSGDDPDMRAVLERNIRVVRERMAGMKLNMPTSAASASS